MSEKNIIYSWRWLSAYQEKTRFVENSQISGKSIKDSCLSYIEPRHWTYQDVSVRLVARQSNET